MSNRAPEGVVGCSRNRRLQRAPISDGISFISLYLYIFISLYLYIHKYLYIFISLYLYIHKYLYIFIYIYSLYVTPGKTTPLTPCGTPWTVHWMSALVYTLWRILSRNIAAFDVVDRRSAIAHIKPQYCGVAISHKP